MSAMKTTDVVRAGYKEVGVVLASHSTDERGRIHLTPLLASEGEVDYWIDQLIEDLNKSRKAAKRELSKEWPLPFDVKSA